MALSEFVAVDAAGVAALLAAAAQDVVAAGRAVLDARPALCGVVSDVATMALDFALGEFRVAPLRCPRPNLV